MSDTPRPPVPPLRATVAELAPFRPPPIEADPGAGAGARRLHLNEGPFPPSPASVAAIREAAAGVHRYPDPRSRRLAAALAARISVPVERLVFGNGSEEILSILLAMTGGGHAVLPIPSFPRYFAVAKFVGGRVTPVPVRQDGANDVGAMLAAITPETRIVVVATPNNPTGAMLDGADLERLARGLPAHALLMLDEAYHEFSRHAGGPDVLTILKDCKAPWAVLRTFSKAYGLAGLRIGYAITGDGALAEAFNRVRGVFNVDSIAQAAALAALGDEAHVRNLLDDCARQRRRLSEGLARAGCAPLPSVANFITARMPIPAAEAVKAFAARGILIGALGTPPFENHIRITIGTGEDTDAVLAALAEIVRA
ncbi:MAG: aminotransferase class I/II-fold pyridoxal phosphate-dependent enzyme [Alphaproteobacteria bacterium]|nr:aminotransferase class I/II-fold pyridoxal phosphate-dependent enzyme [Alphaproteobacteria bacterium]